MTTRLFAVLLAFLVALPGIADAGPGRAACPADLQDEVRKGNRRTVEVIVDGDDAAISRLLGRHPLELKRRLRRGAVLEVPAGQLDALAGRCRRGGCVGQRGGHLAHGADHGDDRRRRGVGGPGDVAGRGERLGRGRGHRRLGHLAAQLAGRQGGGERGLHARPQPRPRPRRLRARHAHRRHRRRRGAATGKRKTRRGRHGPRRAPDQPAGARRHRRRPGGRRGRGHRLGDRQPRPVHHPRHQPVARHAGDPVLPGRPDGPGGGARREGRHRGGGVGRQPRPDRRRQDGAGERQLARQLALRHHGWRAARQRHRRPRRRHAGALELARPDRRSTTW